VSVTTDQTVATAGAGLAAATMTDLLDRLRELTDAAGRPDLGQRLAAAHARVADPHLRIVVTGQGGMGMSSLIGALLELPEPSGDTEPVVIQYGDQLQLVRMNRAAGTGPVTRIQSPHKLLAGGLVFVDVPGTDGADSRRAATALSLLAGADAVLFISDASQEYTEPEIAYLNQIQQLCPTVVGVITKIDLYPRWADIQRADRRHLTAAGLDIPLLPVSAAMSDVARRTGDEALAVESGLPQLAGFLQERVVGDADAVVRTAVVNDIRAVCDHLALAMNAELDALLDPARGADLLERLRVTREAAEQLRQRSANWQHVLGDGITELAVDVEHDLRQRLRHLIREAEADIMRADPVKRWDAFSAQLDDSVAECVRANFVLAHTGATRLAASVGARFSDDGRVALPELALDDTGEVLDPVQTLEPIDSRKAGVVQRVINSLRGSYGGILMVGVTTSLVGLALMNPWSIGAGVLLGANTFREDRKALTARRQAEAKMSVARLMDDVVFQVGKESKYRLRELQRTLRDHFTAVATEMLRSGDDALRAAQEANQYHAEQRATRTTRIQDDLAALRQVRVRAATLADR
jgi:hypothetical protein